ncbi:MAG: 50S ribosomal protein L3 [Candidatus Cloacimonetes bacterium]|jgi:large subunit ribosomal protein L3|nr:50S ribosomal protein L3 [Candidatus Cloacimonadota bacterium]MDD4157355.1 50S ribosomal protein L3 [Candidatus Cloacimonadota bacterium]
MVGLIGKKIGMTQVFDENGKVIPVTLIKAGPCTVVQRKTVDHEGYASIQLGFEEIPERKVKKPQLGHFKKHKSKNFRYLKEFRVTKGEEIFQGDELDVKIFQEKEIVKVIGVSKGKGFQGGMKRHGFAGFEQSHGVHESFRGPGSIGQCAQPSRVFKGVKMAGHLGSARTTVKNLQIVKVDAENNLVMVKGAIPGHINSVVILSK